MMQNKISSLTCPLPIWQYLAKPGFLPEDILAHSGRAKKTICQSLFPARLKAVYRDLYAYKMQTYYQALCTSDCFTLCKTIYNIFCMKSDIRCQKLYINFSCKIFYKLLNKLKKKSLKQMAW